MGVENVGVADGVFVGNAVGGVNVGYAVGEVNVGPIVGLNVSGSQAK